MDGQKRIRCHQHHRQKQPKLRQRKHRDEQPNADDGQIPELPEPERGFGVQVIRVNINTLTSMNSKRRSRKQKNNHPASLQENLRRRFLFTEVIVFIFTQIT